MRRKKRVHLWRLPSEERELVPEDGLDSHETTRFLESALAMARNAGSCSALNELLARNPLMRKTILDTTSAIGTPAMTSEPHGREGSMHGATQRGA